MGTELERLLAAARAAVDNMSPEELVAMRRRQRFNWVYGEALIRALDRKNEGRGGWLRGPEVLTPEEEARVRAMVVTVMGFDGFAREAAPARKPFPEGDEATPAVASPIGRR